MFIKNLQCAILMVVHTSMNLGKSSTIKSRVYISPFLENGLVLVTNANKFNAANLMKCFSVCICVSQFSPLKQSHCVATSLYTSLASDRSHLTLTIKEASLLLSLPLFFLSLPSSLPSLLSKAGEN